MSILHFEYNNNITNIYSSRSNLSEEAKINLLSNIYTLEELENVAISLCDRLIAFSKYVTLLVVK